LGQPGEQPDTKDYLKFGLPDEQEDSQDPQDNHVYSISSPHLGVSFPFSPEHWRVVRPRAVFCHFTRCSGVPGMMLTTSHKKSERSRGARSGVFDTPVCRWVFAGGGLAGIMRVPVEHDTGIKGIYPDCDGEWYDRGVLTGG
jgi:hypothetical protein